MLDKKRAEELRKKIEKLREVVLDDEQIDAVDAILDDWKQENGFIFPIVDGPPGTGKTTVGSVATLQYLLENPRRQVLYMCYTNQACAMAQRAMIKVLEDSELILRLGYGQRTSWKERVVGYGRESIRSDEEVRKLDSVPALISTLYSSSMAIQHRRRCKVIFDEFSQINPALFFDVIYRIRSKVPDGFALLGDPLQLPVVTSQPRLETNIGTYIWSLKNITPIPLKVQHRMHEDICSAINSMRNVLGGKQPLVSAPNVRRRDMTTWYEWKKSAAGAGAKYRDILDPSHPLVIVNTDSLSGGVPGAEEVVSRRRVSCRNVPEASLAADLFAAASVTYERTAPETAGFQILTPYGAQTREIREQLGRRLGSFKKSICDTIHSSQGNEYDLVIVSFVRSNIGGRLGFMEDERLASLAYVACSRAKAKLIVLLSEGTFLVGRHKVFDALCSTKEAHRVEAPT